MGRCFSNICYTKAVLHHGSLKCIETLMVLHMQQAHTHDTHVAVGTGETGGCCSGCATV